MMKMKTAMVLAAVSVLVSGCAETKSPGKIEGVSAQDPWYGSLGNQQRMVAAAEQSTVSV